VSHEKDLTSRVGSGIVLLINGEPIRSPRDSDKGHTVNT
jgi:hypothetical protein